ncbi:uncharacterized protein K489DRAFT_378307 [Dissoconium aciculare CBS 342.82]|uniref:Uncharacterized protein n=1 Tax=Dissoconium aciculare CBS 342.82 TaxID=1314786 RepID=A0A6J3M787_9PEZI|nr:uncharacterized protein K489DRAFT_378307 [Dissoconium aciculare CBS 342.82]KAF1823931.1 hypothetical protein K489DRAFT_378307 [Dissoconium aciculare CBS 342.82]
MRFSLIAAALPLLAVASPVVKRATDADVTAISTAISYIAGNITKLDNQINKLGVNDTIGGLFTLFSTGDLQKAITNTETVVDGVSGQFDDNQSGALAIPLTQLVPKVVGLLNDIVKAHPKIRTALLGGDASFIVAINLKDSYTKTQSFEGKLVAKLSAQYQAIAPQVTSQIDTAFQAAIADYS